MENSPEVLVVGAGVIGLSTGIRLAERGVRVRIRAERPPRGSTSAAAGALWGQVEAHHPHLAVWGRRTYREFEAMLARPVPGIRLVTGIEAARRPASPSPWIHGLPGYAGCAPDELPPGFAVGWRYSAPVLDMPVYLDHLERRFAEAGGELTGGRLSSLDEAFAEAPVVVNCSGPGARELVPDPTVEPIRGHLVVVRNPGLEEFFVGGDEDTEEELTYLFPQGDLLVLGGSAQRGESGLTPSEKVVRGIVARCTEVFPQVAGAEVVEIRVGLRPGRPTVRLEHQDLGDRHLIHNYGHGGAGVSLSWGCADDVADLVSKLSR
jgi:D-amino-acid oxidase